MATEVAVETQQNWIGGKWVPAASGQTFEDRNPADRDEIVGLFPKSDKRDVDAAVAAAKKAYPGLEEHAGAAPRGGPLRRRPRSSSATRKSWRG